MPPLEDPAGEHDTVRRLRDLAHQGELSSTFRSAGREEHDDLLRALYSITWPVVFNRITRPVELRRGHPRCAKGVEALIPECADRFHDDVAAVLAATVRRATDPITDLEGWIAVTSTYATVDAHRKRRGEVGALQRPRLSLWLRGRLGDDPWLTTLAVHVLEWVGVPTTAGTGLWPLSSWAQRRAEVTSDWAGSTREVVAAEVEVVLAAMRTRPTWYADHVEGPLGHKRAPTMPHPDADAVFPPLALVEPSEGAESLLTDAAVVAMRAIEVRLRRGEEPRAAVLDVVRHLFCGDDGVVPAAGHDTGSTEEWLAGQLLDDAGVERIVAAVLRVVLDADEGTERTG